MNQENNQKEIFNTDPVLKVFHVGGRGGLGPTEYLFPISRDLSITLFEADIENNTGYDNISTDYKRNWGISLSVMQQCLSNIIGKKEFNINVVETSSSLFKVDPNTKSWTHGPCHAKWGDMCTPKRSIEIDVTTIDELYTDKKIQMPDFLSLDAQGAEYDILEGASIALMNSLVGIVTEVEFSPIYDRQKLFADQDILLRKHQFNLVDLYNVESWYPGPMIGKGHFMVAEALFLRDYRYFINRYRESSISILSSLAKLAIASYCFDRTSYAFNIMEYIMNNFEHEWNNYTKSNDTIYLKGLTEFYARTKGNN